MAGMTHILIVQEDERLRALYRLNLEVAGFCVSEAADGKEALRIARGQPPDLVVLDLALPVMDGWAALGELKTDKELCTIPVVILTASAAESEELLARERGAMAFLARPIGVEDITAAIQRALLKR